MTEEKVFENTDFTKFRLPDREFDTCRFINCDFSEINFSDCTLLECVFERCNMGRVNLNGTTMKDVCFRQSNLLGVDFSVCNKILLSVTFEECRLDLSSFYRLPFKNTRFKKCSVREADFIETDLTEAVFEECDLKGAVFIHSILEKADLRSAENFSIDPENNRINKAKFSITGLKGLLSNYDIEIE